MICPLYSVYEEAMAGQESLRYAFIKDLSPLDERIVKADMAFFISNDDIHSSLLFGNFIVHICPTAFDQLGPLCEWCRNAFERLFLSSTYVNKRNPTVP